MIPAESAPTFGGLLRQHREEAGFTQSALAVRASLSTEAVSLLERGRRRAPRHDTVALLASALGLKGQAEAAFLQSARSPAPAARERAMGTARHNLVAPLTACLGRERELEWTARYFRGGGRLLTVTGPAGVGKTRLALAAAWALLEDFVGGVWFVDLAPLTSPQQLDRAIREVVGVDAADTPTDLATAVRGVGGTRVLFVLDNFEHLAAAASAVSDLLRRWRCLSCLVTSRAPLHVSGEQELPVGPLTLPPSRERATLELAARSPAVALFVERIQACMPEFRLDGQNAASISEICRRLDGLPLALELAAPWTRLLLVDGLLDRLDERLSLLVRGAHDLPERQRTMRRALAWSCDLLDAGERPVFPVLAVFSGSASLDAIGAVAAAAVSGGPEVMSVVASLLDKHLVHQVPGDEPRVSMLGIVREYARELLDADGSARNAEAAHAAYFEALAAAAEPHLVGRESVSWLARLARDHDNLRAAIDWARSGGRPLPGLRIAAPLWRFWLRRGDLREGFACLDSLIGSCPDPPPELLAKALLGAGSLAWPTGHHAAGRQRLDASLALYEALGDRAGISAALNARGLLAFAQADYEQACRFYHRSLEVRRSLGDDWGVAGTLNNLANVMFQLGDHRLVVTFQEEALSLRRALGDRSGTASSLTNLGDMCRVVGDRDRAREFLEEAVELCRGIGDDPTMAIAVLNLADFVRGDGDCARATELYAESLELCEKMGEHSKLPRCLEGLAAAAWAFRDWRRALRMYAAAAALRSALALPAEPACRRDHEAVVGEIRRAVPAGLFRAQWTLGAAMSSEEAVAEARQGAGLVQR